MAGLGACFAFGPRGPVGPNPALRPGEGAAPREGASWSSTLNSPVREGLRGAAFGFGANGQSLALPSPGLLGISAASLACSHGCTAVLGVGAQPLALPRREAAAPGWSWDGAERPSRAWAGLCLPAPCPSVHELPAAPLAPPPDAPGPGAAALLTLLLLGDSFFLPGNPPGQTKKALKQRFLKLLPCCRPKSIPSLSESKLLLLAFVCVCPQPRCWLPPPLPRGFGGGWGVRINPAPGGVRSDGLCTHLAPCLLPGCFYPFQRPGVAAKGCTVVGPSLEPAGGGRTPPAPVPVEGLGDVAGSSVLVQRWRCDGEGGG